MELHHYGIKGQKWGKRRYQNEDGTLTPAGKERYLKGEKMSSHDASLKKAQKYGEKSLREYVKIEDKYDKLISKALSEGDIEKADKLDWQKNNELTEKVYKPFYKNGYEYVDRGRYFSSDKLITELRFGKYATDKQWDEYERTGKLAVEQFVISTEDFKVLEDEDW